MALLCYYFCYFTSISKVQNLVFGKRSRFLHLENMLSILCNISKNVSNKWLSVTVISQVTLENWSFKIIFLPFNRSKGVVLIV